MEKLIISEERLTAPLPLTLLSLRGTIETTNASTLEETIDRIIDVFPPYQQMQIRYQLSTALKAIFTQQLLQKADMSGRIPAVEILINIPAVANLIREGKQFQIYSVLQTSQKDGMQTMDGAIKELYTRGAITRQEALANVHNMLEFDELLKGANTRAQN